MKGPARAGAQAAFPSPHTALRPSGPGGQPAVLPLCPWRQAPGPPPSLDRGWPWAPGGVWARGGRGRLRLGWGFRAALQGDPPPRPQPTLPSARLWREAAALSWGAGGRPGLCLWSLAFPSRTREGCPRGTSPVPAAVGGWRGPPRARGNQGSVRVPLPPRACPALQRRCPRAGASMARWRGRQGPPTPGGWRGEVVGCVVSGQ